TGGLRPQFHQPVPVPGGRGISFLLRPGEVCRPVYK
ncbi:formate dehydrogenase accessory protein FdhE, partial [Salmonella enterica subsp. enterica]|nr:formate dehydrogenase accessory protein FdhE [Salmonella enterica subsp. enterica serovar Kentucky]